MGQHTRRYVFNLAHELIVGWPSTFNMSGTPDDDMEATEFYINAPAAGFLRIQKFVSIRREAIEFFRFHLPFVCCAALPGPPVDPFEWMESGNLKARIQPLPLGPSVAHGGLKDVRMRIEYTGLVPKGMKAGDRFKCVVFFMGVEDA